MIQHPLNHSFPITHSVKATTDGFQQSHYRHHIKTKRRTRGIELPSASGSSPRVLPATFQASTRAVRNVNIRRLEVTKRAAISSLSGKKSRFIYFRHERRAELQPPPLPFLQTELVLLSSGVPSCNRLYKYLVRSSSFLWWRKAHVILRSTLSDRVVNPHPYPGYSIFLHPVSRETWSRSRQSRRCILLVVNRRCCLYIAIVRFRPYLSIHRFSRGQ